CSTHPLTFRRPARRRVQPPAPGPQRLRAAQTPGPNGGANKTKAARREGLSAAVEARRGPPQTHSRRRPPALPPLIQRRSSRLGRGDPRAPALSLSTPMATIKPFGQEAPDAGHQPPPIVPKAST